MSRRDEIVEAAQAVFAEGGASAITVRSVAARAGIGASTLRHYFPTQRDLHDAIFSAAFDASLDDLRISDSSVPARERLAECIQQFITPVDAPGNALERWVESLATMITSRASEEMRTAWSAFARQAHTRVRSWLDVLAAEGALLPGSTDRQARMLLALVDGLALAMMVPESRPTSEQVRETLDDAIAAIVR
ncbi:AcrR family transcriptional regulator [Leifsonia sp. AK011]|uniref:TetR/AcrR family transcriptional regulator n=1 Tax=Leifsonia sp. AK011 TaxID=2723075 RepID=UPI0015C9A85C|nr:TetR/AcrR family transcriptional regulator [Leifsonia sp. AK011]NYF09213.1 AcrR family transcriptional regulator [Leifsonia sp. AK011]